MIRFPEWYSRRTLFVGAGCILLVIGLLVVTSLFRPKKEEGTKETRNIAEQSTANRQAFRVFIKDFYTYQNSIDPQTQRWIEHLIYTYPSQSQPDIYTGVIRPGSYSDSATSDGLSKIELLVDTEPSNVTYKVTVIAKRNTDFQTVDVSCAQKEQQMNQTTTCRDGASRE